MGRVGRHGDDEIAPRLSITVPRNGISSATDSVADEVDGSATNARRSIQNRKSKTKSKIENQHSPS